MPDGLLKQHPDDATRQVADLPSPRVQAHAANLMVLGDSSLACVWFGGSMEGRSLLDLIGFKHDLEDCLHRQADVVTEEGLHPLIRQHVLGEARPL